MKDALGKEEVKGGRYTGRGQSKLGHILKPDMIRMDSATVQTHVSKYYDTNEAIREREKSPFQSSMC